MSDRLSRNFNLSEYTRSQTATRAGIDNEPTPEHLGALAKHAQRILQPIRDHFGRPVRISSGYRCLELDCAIKLTALNKRRALRGHDPHTLDEYVATLAGRTSKWSQHSKGEAADIEVDGVANNTLAKWIRDVGLPFDQLILEFFDPAKGPKSGWIHVSHSAGDVQRGQVLTAIRDDNGRVKYKTGLLF